MAKKTFNGRAVLGLCYGVVLGFGAAWLMFAAPVRTDVPTEPPTPATPTTPAAATTPPTTPVTPTTPTAIPRIRAPARSECVVVESRKFDNHGMTRVIGRVNGKVPDWLLGDDVIVVTAYDADDRMLDRSYALVGDNGGFEVHFFEAPAARVAKLGCERE